MILAKLRQRISKVWAKAESGSREEESLLMRVIVTTVIATRVLSLANLKDLYDQGTPWRQNFMDLYLLLWLCGLCEMLARPTPRHWHGWIAAYYVLELCHYRVYFLFAKGWDDPWLLNKLRRSLTLALITTIQLVMAYATMFRVFARIGPPGLNPVKAALLTPTQALYFSAVTFTTVGFGDFVALDGNSQLLVMSELGAAILTLALIIPLVLTGFAGGFHRQEKAHSSTK